MRHLNSQSRHCRLDEMCVRDCNEISLFFIFLFRKDFYVTSISIYSFKVCVNVITLFGDEI